MVKWNNNNHLCHILNVDESCIGTPTRAGFGGIIRNSTGFYLSGFSDFISNSTNILLAEISAIHHGLLLAADMGIGLLLRISCLCCPSSEYKAFLSSRNFSIQHSLREENQCANFIAKLEASSNDDFLIHSSPPKDLLALLRNNSSGTFFLRV